MLVFTCLAERNYENHSEWRGFRRQLFQSALKKILKPLLKGMTNPVVLQCPDGHFRRAIYGLGPYIADYPEQCLLASVVQGWCPTYDYFIVNSHVSSSYKTTKQLPCSTQRYGFY
jgi:Plavaka transposase